MVVLVPKTGKGVCRSRPSTVALPALRFTRCVVASESHAQSIVLSALGASGPIALRLAKKASRRALATSWSLQNTAVASAPLFRARCRVLTAHVLCTVPLPIGQRGVTAPKLAAAAPLAATDTWSTKLQPVELSVLSSHRRSHALMTRALSTAPSQAGVAGLNVAIAAEAATIIVSAL